MFGGRGARETLCLLVSFFSFSSLYFLLFLQHATLGQGSTPTLPHLRPSRPHQGAPSRRLVIGGNPLPAGRAPSCAGDASAAARGSMARAGPPRGQTGGCVSLLLPPCRDVWSPGVPPGPCPWGSSTLAGPAGLVLPRVAWRGVRPASPPTSQRGGLPLSPTPVPPDEHLAGWCALGGPGWEGYIFSFSRPRAPSGTPMNAGDHPPRLSVLPGLRS